MTKQNLTQEFANLQRALGQLKKITLEKRKREEKMKEETVNKMEKFATRQERVEEFC